MRAGGYADPQHRERAPVVDLRGRYDRADAGVDPGLGVVMRPRIVDDDRQAGVARVALAEALDVDRCWRRPGRAAGGPLRHDAQRPAVAAELAVAGGRDAEMTADVIDGALRDVGRRRHRTERVRQRQQETPARFVFPCGPRKLRRARAIARLFDTRACSSRAEKGLTR